MDDDRFVDLTTTTGDSLRGKDCHNNRAVRKERAAKKKKTRKEEADDAPIGVDICVDVEDIVSSGDEEENIASSGDEEEAELGEVEVVDEAALNAKGHNVRLEEEIKSEWNFAAPQPQHEQAISHHHQHDSEHMHWWNNQPRELDLPIADNSTAKRSKKRRRKTTNGSTQQKPKTNKTATKTKKPPKSAPTLKSTTNGCSGHGRAAGRKRSRKELESNSNNNNNNTQQINSTKRRQQQAKHPNTKKNNAGKRKNKTHPKNQSTSGSSSQCNINNKPVNNRGTKKFSKGNKKKTRQQQPNQNSMPQSSSSKSVNKNGGPTNQQQQFPDPEEEVEPVGVDVCVDVVDLEDHFLDDDEDDAEIEKEEAGDGGSNENSKPKSIASVTTHHHHRKAKDEDSNSKPPGKSSKRDGKGVTTKTQQHFRQAQEPSSATEKYGECPSVEDDSMVEPVGVEVSVDVVDLYPDDDDADDDDDCHAHIQQQEASQRQLDTTTLTADDDRAPPAASQSQNITTTTAPCTAQEELLKQQELLIQKLTADLEREKNESHQKDVALQRYKALLQQENGNKSVVEQNNRSTAASIHNVHQPMMSDRHREESLARHSQKQQDVSCLKNAGDSKLDDVVELSSDDDDDGSDEDLFAQDEDHDDDDDGDENRTVAAEVAGTPLTAAVDHEANATVATNAVGTENSDDDEDLFAASDADQGDQVQQETGAAKVHRQTLNKKDAHPDTPSGNNRQKSPEQCASPPSARKISVSDEFETTCPSTGIATESGAPSQLESHTTDHASEKATYEDTKTTSSESVDHATANATSDLKQERGDRVESEGAKDTSESEPEAFSRPNFIVIDDDDDSDDEVEILYTQQVRMSGKKEGRAGRQGFGVSNVDLGKEPYRYVKRPIPPNKRNPSQAMFQGDRDFSWQHSRESAQEAQDRLLRDCVARMKSIGEKDPSRIANSSVPFIGLPMPEIYKQYPHHWKWKDPWSRLGLPRHSSARLIKSHYRKLALLYHPDKLKFQDSTQRFHAITEAYRKLAA